MAIWLVLTLARARHAFDRAHLLLLILQLLSSLHVRQRRHRLVTIAVVALPVPIASQLMAMR